jgi:hypothetical protein
VEIGYYQSRQFGFRLHGMHLSAGDTRAHAVDLGQAAIRE